jgi:hypothetical protein
MIKTFRGITEPEGRSSVKNKNAFGFCSEAVLSKWEQKWLIAEITGT